jgi:hypothetical protein
MASTGVFVLVFLLSKTLLEEAGDNQDDFDLTKHK